MKSDLKTPCLYERDNDYSMNAIREFVKENQDVFDINDTAEFIYYNSDELISLLQSLKQIKIIEIKSVSNNVK